jgi:hypothetical protein
MRDLSTKALKRADTGATGAMMVVAHAREARKKQSAAIVGFVQRMRLVRNAKRHPTWYWCSVDRSGR